MAKFITSNELNAEIEKLFERAEEKLILISPYVLLHDRYKSTLLTKKANDKLEIIVVFGKNEENPSRSIRLEDIDFFKQFPYVQIRHEKRLHAKYYANESSAIITSMNLYNYSQDHNIESGVLTTPPIIRGLGMNLIGTESLDDQAWKYFQRVIEQSISIFEKKPEYEKTMMGLGKKYIKSNIEVDNLSTFFSSQKDIKSTQALSGYCIMSGTKISFNIKRPLIDTAYNDWVKKTDSTYKGKFCHFSGEPGETTFERPILKKNWKKAQDVHRF